MRAEPRNWNNACTMIILKAATSAARQSLENFIYIFLNIIFLFSFFLWAYVIRDCVTGLRAWLEMLINIYHNWPNASLTNYDNCIIYVLNKPKYVDKSSQAHMTAP